MMLVKRVRSRVRLLAAVALVVALAAALTAGLTALAQSTVIDGVAAAVTEARGGDAVVRVSIRWAGQSGGSVADAERAADEQDAAVREALASVMPEAALEAQPSIRSEPLAVEGRDASLVLVSDERLLDRVEIVEGVWPSGIDEAAVHSAAADALGIGIGDDLPLPGADDLSVNVTVTALWLPLDGGDPAWAGEPLAERGVDGLAAGPLVVDEQLWRTLSTRPIAQWISVLDPAAATPAVLDELATGLPALGRTIDDDPRSRGSGVVVDGGLASTVAELQRAAAGVAAILPVALALVVLAALTTLLELQRLLSAVRSDETTLMRSRGASARRLTANAAVEALIIALPSAIVGALVGAALALGAQLGSLELVASAPGPLVVSTIGCAVIITIATVLLGAGVASRRSRLALRRDTLADSGRQTRVVSAAALLLSLIAAGVAVSQFVLYRGPVVPTADGGAAVDPVAALAPVLVLVAGALLAVVLVEPLARLVSRVAARSDRLVPVLIARSVARSTAIVTTPVLLIGLAVGGLVVAAAVDTTTRSSELSARELALGAPLVVSGGVLDAPVRADLGAAGGVADFAGVSWTGAPVAIAELLLADAPGTLVAIDARALPQIVATAGGAVERDRLAAAIESPPLPSVDVPATATSLRLDGDVSARVSFWVADVRGGVLRVASDDQGVAELPELGGPWRVLALDVIPNASARQLDVVLNGIVVAEGDAERIIDFSEPWNARPGVLPGFSGEVLVRDDGRSGFIASVDRVDPGAVRVTPDPAELQLGVTAAAADRFGAVVGDSITVGVAGSGREIEGAIADIVRAVPGAETTAAVAVDLAAAAQSQLAESASPLSITEVWLTPADGAVLDQASQLASAAELRRRAPSGSSVDATSDAAAGALAEGARVALWTAAFGALLLAVVAAAIVSRAIGGVREVDVVVLRAIGVGSQVQARARGAEFVGVLVAATIAGLIIGSATSALLVGDLARALLVDAPAALVLTATVAPALAAAGGLLLLLVIVALGSGASSHAEHQARALSAREVMR
ncbi:ABC transporter permease [Microcella sp.]|uniref:ABC transporter permease n=1 Tax=Microcella sp. TaxID=1913979 RepID=UPI0025687C80|nr:ABC transporter permease [Microcella sp.]MBX9471583.1 ABC transporter permease [Microcella sp.]